MFPLCDVPGIHLRVSLCNELLKLKWSLWWYAYFQNTRSEQMEMTTPVFTRKGETGGEKMDMTTPVITKKARSIRLSHEPYSSGMSLFASLVFDVLTG
jgi:hypothetical protein